MIVSNKRFNALKNLSSDELSTKSRELQASLFQAKMKRASRRAGMPHDGLHILRHSFCSHLAMRGAPARAIQELAGHSDLTMTQRYMHLSPAALDAAIGLLDRASGDQTFGDILATAGPVQK